MNTTAGSFSLLGSIVPEDAGVVKRLRRAGAIILGASSLRADKNGSRSDTTNYQGRLTSLNLLISEATSLQDGRVGVASARALISPMWTRAGRRVALVSPHL